MYVCVTNVCDLRALRNFHTNAYRLYIIEFMRARVYVCTQHIGMCVGTLYVTMYVMPLYVSVSLCICVRVSPKVQ